MEERRLHPRLSVATELWIGQDGIFTRSDEKLLDLSIGGAFIETSQHYSVGCVLNLRFKLPDAARFLTCTAIVRNSRGGQGFGVQFLDLSPDDRWQLDSYIQKQKFEFSY
ncbi:MAG: PilZ domain-containing protein [Acidobacteriota bacterium]|nr:PilZ domain-containing protein [Acidobacteriota bacterium]